MSLFAAPTVKAQPLIFADDFELGETCTNWSATATPELCDGLDNNCSGVADEGLNTIFFPDTDGDGFGDPAVPTDTGSCAPPSGFVADNTDCNDGAATTFPGAQEVCGDLQDNDCDSEIDDPGLCKGAGTFVSALTGDDILGNGTQLNPVQTIAAGVAKATAIGGGVDVFVAEGVYPEKVVLVEGMDLFGGHQCDGSECTWDRDPSQFDSAIFDVDLEGVLAGPSITRSTRFDGFRVVALSGSPAPGEVIAAMTLDEGTPKISNNLLVGGNIASCPGFCNTTAVLIVGPSNDPLGALIERNSLLGGDSTSGTAAVFLRTDPVAEIIGNTIHGGDGGFSRAINAFSSGAGTLIHDNDVFAGSQSGGSGSSFAMSISGSLTVDGNRINTEPAEVGSCPSPTYWCGGINSEGSSAIITNNVVYGMPAPQSAAVFLTDGELSPGEVVLNANTLDGGGAANVSGSISAAVACRTILSGGGPVLRIRNNIELGGQGQTRFGMYEDTQSVPKTCEPAVYENNDIFFPTQAGAVDYAHRTWSSGGVATLLTTVAEVNSVLGYAQDNFTADPLIDTTFHLQTGSLCIDAGTPTEAPAFDFEGDPRPLGDGIDVGADEAE